MALCTSVASRPLSDEDPHIFSINTMLAVNNATCIRDCVISDRKIITFERPTRLTYILNPFFRCAMSSTWIQDLAAFVHIVRLGNGICEGFRGDGMNGRWIDIWSA
ncbi:hypothetical protein PHLCEN_2v12880 [Hermanssonia centrifuga]|uniref:Uncharacterized protein n=1 Tax=Hermanssonia centrifuga TaxID=98765 RepID=A0A2R6NFV0_9APHY|nr:hypothetical protein PHLCEN_2v12880 [Hermanssonia centrifuga]